MHPRVHWIASHALSADGAATVSGVLQQGMGSPDGTAARQPIASRRRAGDTASRHSKTDPQFKYPGAVHPPHQEPAMLHYAVVFFVIALIAALFGFGGIAAGAMGIGKILFVVFAVLAVATFLFGLIRKN